jgi:hypothetical protein
LGAVACVEFVEVAYPSFGLTNLLDDKNARLPEGIEATYPLAQQQQLVDAALAMATNLRQAGHHAQPGGYAAGRLRHRPGCALLPGDGSASAEQGRRRKL